MTTNSDQHPGPGNPGDVFPTKNRCDVCGAAFTTEALLHDHLKLHAATSPAEEQAVLEEQGERKP